MNPERSSNDRDEVELTDDQLSADEIPLADEEPPPRRRPHSFEPDRTEVSAKIRGAHDRSRVETQIGASAEWLWFALRLVTSPWYVRAMTVFSLLPLLTGHAYIAVGGLVCVMGMCAGLPSSSRGELRIAWWVAVALYFAACGVAFSGISS